MSEQWALVMTTPSDGAADGRMGGMLLARWVVVAVVIGVGTLLVGLVANDFIGGLGPAGGWTMRAAIGDSFGTIDAIASGLGLAALVVTLRMQSRELHLQRQELEMQRQEISRSRVELFRSAEADLRALHVELIKLSLSDPSLAAVWPPLEPGAAPERERQLLYANLLYQHIVLSCRINDYSEEQRENRIRYLFTSPLMRDYWRASSKGRMASVAGSPEYVFGEVVDRICSEYEDLLVAARSAAPLIDANARTRTFPG